MIDVLVRHSCLGVYMIGWDEIGVWQGEAWLGCRALEYL